MSCSDRRHRLYRPVVAALVTLGSQAPPRQSGGNNLGLINNAAIASVDHLFAWLISDAARGDGRTRPDEEQCDELGEDVVRGNVALLSSLQLPVVLRGERMVSILPVGKGQPSPRIDKDHGCFSSRGFMP
jgi:hypothetical protein